jgi:hypothetical protein
MLRIGRAALFRHLCVERQPAEETEPMSDYRVRAGEATEDQFTAAIEKYTAPIPSSAYLALALASIAASITIQAVQKEKANAALYVGQWVAPFLPLGIYNKMVKQHGSDAKTK